MVLKDLIDLLIAPAIAYAVIILIFGIITFIELWKGEKDDDRKGKK